MVFNNSEFDKYSAEVKAKWGSTDAYREFSEKSKSYSSEKQSSIAEEMNGIFSDFALCLKSGLAPDSAQAQDLVKRLKNHITENYYQCTDEILSALGQMYTIDERFKHNIDRHTDGTAQFICKAIEAFCGK